MPTLHYFQYLTAVVDGEEIEIGSLTKPWSVDIDGEGIRRTHSVGTETTQNLWSASTDLATFNFALIRCDYPVIVEYVIDDGNEVGTVASTLNIPGTAVANRYGAWQPFLSQTAKANYTKNFAAGTDDLIEVIRSRNESDTNTAKVEIAVFK